MKRGNLFGVVTAIIISVAVAGCVQYKGAKVVKGTDLSVGINVPTTENTLQLQLLNYLSGFRLGIEDNATLDMSYDFDNETSCFGVVSFHDKGVIKAKVGQAYSAGASSVTNATEAASCESVTNAPSGAASVSGVTFKDDGTNAVRTAFSPVRGVVSPFVAFPRWYEG